MPSYISISLNLETPNVKQENGTKITASSINKLIELLKSYRTMNVSFNEKRGTVFLSGVYVNFADTYQIQKSSEEFFVIVNSVLLSN